MERTDGQSNNLQPPKKPSGSVSSRLYLKAAIRHYLYKADQQLTEKAAFEKLEIARDLSRRLRNRGASPWWPLVFACTTFVVLVLVAQRRTMKDFTYLERLQILQRYDAYHYKMSHLGVPFDVKFCPNYEPQLSAGQTIVWIHYADLGRCWDILPEGYGYRLQRDAAGNPTLAPNCFVNDRDVTECKPNPTEARF